MKIIEKCLEGKSPNYPIERLAKPEQILFINIETTGFTAKSSNLYLIGCIYFKNDSWNTIQWIAENYDEEVEVLQAFLEFSLGYTFFIHFNGNKFDIPYLQQKCEIYNIPFLFEVFKGVDIYKRVKPYQSFMKLEDCKQKTLEGFLGIKRMETVAGGELINYYHDYVCNHSEELFDAIVLHNAETLLGMFDLIAILAIPDLFNLQVRVMKVQANYYNDYDNKKRQELILNLRFMTPLPVPLSYQANGCYFTGNDMNGMLKVPLCEGELKYFYSNYKDYYYIPSEDTAIHKSVAGFVDKDNRKQATAATCYTRKVSTYLPEWELVFTPFYKRSYRDKEIFFELTDEFKTSRESFNKYAEHILSVMALES